VTRVRKQQASWRDLIAYAALLALVSIIAVVGTEPHQRWGWAPQPVATAFTVFRLALVIATIASVPITALRSGGAREAGLVIITTTLWLYMTFLGIDWRLGFPLSLWELANWFFIEPMRVLVSTIASLVH